MCGEMLRWAAPSELRSRAVEQSSDVVPAGLSLRDITYNNAHASRAR